MAKIDNFFIKMVELGASDLHLTSGTQPRFRQGGELKPVVPEVYTPEMVMETLQEILPEKFKEQFLHEWDVDFAYALPGYGRYRANFFWDRIGPGAVFRLIPDKILTFDQLNLSQAIRELCYLSKGLVLVTGPTGSGKSTTLTAMVDLINTERNEHLITIEDPIEFVHANKKCLINQREVGQHTKTFKSALRAALREDPDIIVVGEMRDLETVEIAIETAETGHLVFGTLHTSTAPSTVDRIIDQFPAARQAQIRVMLASSLKGVISQTLCRKIGGGRIAALEILIITSGIANNIREGKTYQIPSAIQTGMKHGMILLNDALEKLLKDKIIDAEEAFIKCIDKEDMKKKLAGLKMDLKLGGS